MEDRILLTERKVLIRRLIQIKEKGELRKLLASSSGDSKKPDLIPPIILLKDSFLLSNLKLLTFVDESQFRTLLMIIIFDGYLQEKNGFSDPESTDYLYLEELIQFSISCTNLVSRELKKNIHDLLFGRLFEIYYTDQKEWPKKEKFKNKNENETSSSSTTKEAGQKKERGYIESLVRYQFFKSAQMFQETEEEEWQVLQCLLPITKEVGKFEEVLKILRKIKEMASAREKRLTSSTEDKESSEKSRKSYYRDIIIKCNYEILEVLETIRDSMKSQTDQDQDILEQKIASFNDKIVEFVLNFASEENDLLNYDQKVKLLREFSVKYRDHKELQNRIPEEEASQNYFKAGLELLKKGSKNEDDSINDHSKTLSSDMFNLTEADMLFEESIRKDPMNLFAHEGKREILKKKLNMILEKQVDLLREDERRKKMEEEAEHANSLFKLCFRIYKRFFDVLDTRKRVSLMEDVIDYSGFLDAQVPVRMLAIHNRDTLLLHEKVDHVSISGKDQMSGMNGQIETLKMQVAEMNKKMERLVVENESLKRMVCKMSRNKPEKAMVLIHLRKQQDRSHFICCGVRWQLRIVFRSNQSQSVSPIKKNQMKEEKEEIEGEENSMKEKKVIGGPADIWLFHDIKRRSIHLAKTSKIEHYEVILEQHEGGVGGGGVGICGKKGRLLNTVRLSARITEEDGWKIFENLDLLGREVVMFDIQMSVRHDSGTSSVPGSPQL